MGKERKTSVTDEWTNGPTNGVTMSLLELLIAAKNVQKYKKIAYEFFFD